MYHFFKAITGQCIQRNCSMYSVCMHYTYKKEDSVIQSSNACILCLLTPAVPCCSMHRGGFYPIFCPVKGCHWQLFITAWYIFSLEYRAMTIRMYTIKTQVLTCLLLKHILGKFDVYLL